MCTCAGVESYACHEVLVLRAADTCIRKHVHVAYMHDHVQMPYAAKCMHMHAHAHMPSHLIKHWHQDGHVYTKSEKESMLEESTKCV